MKLPTMIIILNKEMSDKLPCGIKCAFSAHSAMWLHDSLAWLGKGSNRYGEFASSGKHIDYDIYGNGWLREDYRKLVMTSPETIESLFEKFKKAEVPVYMQRTSHDIRCLPEKGYERAGTPICVACFIWKDEQKKLLDGCELL